MDSTTVGDNLTSTMEEANFLFATQLLTSSIPPAILKVAVELDLLELIKKQGPEAFVSSAELAAQIPTTNPEAHNMLDRILSLLVSYSVLNCSLKTLPDGGFERLYSLAPVSKYFTKNDDGVSLAPVLLMYQEKAFMEIWYHLKDGILDGGIPFHKAHEMSLFEYHAKDSRFNKVFYEAMSNSSTMYMKKIVEIYDGFKGLESLVDVGGGIGASLNTIISKHPTIKGINFDLPHVVQHAQSYSGIEHIGGDMFVSVPKGDAIFIKWVLHDWSDFECLKILKNCHEALPKNGKVIVVEYFLAEIPNKEIRAKVGLHLDVTMLGFFSGAKERTEKEFQSLAKQAGFREFRKVCCVFNLWIMEFYK